MISYDTFAADVHAKYDVYAYSRGSRGVNMASHNARMLKKRRRMNKIARQSRKVNRGAK